MDFDKDNFEEDNELAPLEEEEAGDVDEVVGVETEEIVADDDSEDESELPKRGSTSSAPSGRAASKPPARKARAKPAKRRAPAKRASVGKSKKAAKKAAKKAGGKSKGKKSSKKKSAGKKRKR
jgi:hypothetical protein